MARAPEFSTGEGIDVLASVVPGAYVLRVNGVVAGVTEEAVDVVVGGYVLTFDRADIDCAQLEFGGRCEVTAGAERERTPLEDYSDAAEVGDPD